MASTHPPALGGCHRPCSRKLVHLRPLARGAPTKGEPMSAARIVVWSEDDCRRVHEATLTSSPRPASTSVSPALEVFAAAGGRVDGSRVRLDAAAVDKALASAPRTWTVRSRGRDEVLELRNGLTYFGTGSDCLFYRDPDTGERRRVRTPTSKRWRRSRASPPPRLRDVDGVARRRAAGRRRPFGRRLDARRHAQAAHGGDAQRRRREGRKDMCAAAGAPDSFMIYAMPAPPLMHDRDGLTKLSLRRARGAGDLGGGPQRRLHRAALDRRHRRRGQRRDARRPRLPPADPPGAPSSSASASAPWTCAPRSTPTPRPRARSARPPGRPLPLVRAAQLQLRGYVRCQHARRAVRPRIRPHRHVRRAAARHSDPRRGLSRSGLQSSCESIVFGNAAIGWASLHGDVPTTDEALALDEIIGSVRAATSWPASTRAPTRATSGTTTSSTTPSTTAGTPRVARPCSTGSGQVAELRATRAFAPDPAANARVAKIMQAAGREREA